MKKILALTLLSLSFAACAQDIPKKYTLNIREFVVETDKPMSLVEYKQLINEPHSDNKLYTISNIKQEVVEGQVSMTKTDNIRVPGDYAEHSTIDTLAIVTRVEPGIKLDLNIVTGEVDQVNIVNSGAKSIEVSQSSRRNYEFSADLKEKDSLVFLDNSKITNTGLFKNKFIMVSVE